MSVYDKSLASAFAGSPIHEFFSLNCPAPIVTACSSLSCTKATTFLEKASIVFEHSLTNAFVLLQRLFPSKGAAAVLALVIGTIVATMGKNRLQQGVYKKQGES